MEVAMRAIEATGTIDVQHQLVLDKPLPAVGPTQVRVIILLPEEADIDEEEWLQAEEQLLGKIALDRYETLDRTQLVSQKDMETKVGLR